LVRIEFRFDEVTKASEMFDSGALQDELLTLKNDVTHLLGTASDGILDASKNQAKSLADQIGAALNDLGESLGEEEDRVEKLLSDRPIASLASAFALGVVVGLMLRRQ
jgi:ElaB/YqjD/DUF883 family membrane-anchored ribosome-binding protein